MSDDQPEPAVSERLRRVRVNLKPWREQLLRAIFADVSEEEAKSLAGLYDTAVEAALDVRFDELEADVNRSLKIMRESAAEAKAKAQRETEAAVLACLRDVFGEDVQLVSLTYEVEGRLTSEECHYYDGARDDVGDEIDSNLDAAYEVKFRIGHEGNPIARIAFSLGIEWYLDFSSGKVYVEDLIQNTTHGADCNESVSIFYPKLPVLDANDPRWASQEDALRDLAGNIAVAVGVEEWVIVGHTTINLYPDPPLCLPE
jgi:hypothetical protein